MARQERFGTPGAAGRQAWRVPFERSDGRAAAPAGQSSGASPCRAGRTPGERAGSRTDDRRRQPERNRLNFSDVVPVDGHAGALTHAGGRGDGQFQPHHEDPAGDLGRRAGRVAGRQPRRRPHAPARCAAGAGRRHRRAAARRGRCGPGGRPRGARRRSGNRLPSASGSTVAAPQLSRDALARDHRGAAAGHGDGRRVRLHRAPARRARRHGRPRSRTCSAATAPPPRRCARRSPRCAAPPG